MINLSSEEITSKNLVIRVDMNVPIKDGIVLDSTRIEACIPTIMFALNRGARILLISHLGRPTEGSFDEKFSLKPVAESLSKIINMSCEVINDIESEHIFKSESVIQVLENIRFFKGEKENCKDLGYKLANLGDIYVFDAFGTAHREQASTHAAIEHASIACAGLLMEKENKFLSQALDSFKAPYIAIIGGAKVSSKLELIKHINSVADHIIVGGGIANTFLKAAGLNVGKSLVEDSMLDIAKELIEEGKIVLPRNVTTSKLFEGKDIKEKSVNEITEEEMSLKSYFKIRGFFISWRRRNVICN